MLNGISRETIFTNLFTLLQGAKLPSPFPPTWVMSGRKLLHWDVVPPASQPAMFMHQGLQTSTQPTLPLNQWKMQVQVWVYFRADGSNTQDTPPDTLVNGILDAIDAVLEIKSPSLGMFQTLGGTVYHCTISGTVAADSGLGDGQGVIVVPIEITTGQ